MSCDNCPLRNNCYVPKVLGKQGIEGMMEFIAALRLGGFVSSSDICPVYICDDDRNNPIANTLITAYEQIEITNELVDKFEKFYRNDKGQSELEKASSVMSIITAAIAEFCDNHGISAYKTLMMMANAINNVNQSDAMLKNMGYEDGLLDERAISDLEKAKENNVHINNTNENNFTINFSSSDNNNEDE